ncbi:MAG: hypothetical protein PWP52_1281 [Bacteroidales bacterium]|jgi:hypothetical protein|nr:hypothetical protein [Bacteroidales bacterium]
MKKVIQIVLAIAIVVLAYLIWESIQTPIRFNKEKDKRYEATIQKMKDIRTAQLAYKDEYGHFTGSFDTLINFIETDSMKVVRAEGSLSDELLEQGWTEAIAVQEGLIKRDTIRIAIKDTLFSPNYPAKNLWKVPFTENDSIEMAAAKVDVSNTKVNVFEAKVHNDVLLHGLDEQLIINLNERMKNANNFPGVKVGDINQPNNNAGNWE